MAVIQSVQQYLVAHSQNIVLGAAVLIAGIVAILVITWLVGRFFDRVNMDETVERFLQRAFSAFLWAMLIIVVLDNLGFNVTGFVAGLGVIGITVGFATKDIFSNIAAGALLLITKPFRLRDNVEVAGIKGTVQQMNLSYSVLATDEAHYVAVPNTKIWGSPIKNFSRGKI